MNSDASNFIEQEKFFFIQQVKEWAEILVGFETANKYEVSNKNGNSIGGIFEKGTGFIKMLSRMFLRTHRPMDIGVVNKEGKEVLNLQRPFFFFFSDLIITDNQGKLIGYAKRKFGFILFKKYDLLDKNGKIFGKISSPIYKIWTFDVTNILTNTKFATISKKWGGILKEAFSDADRFGVDLSDQSLKTEQKLIIFATAITIDFDFFEDNSGKATSLID
jgi:uncharacterized protein YxjI